MAPPRLRGSSSSREISGVMGPTSIPNPVAVGSSGLLPVAACRPCSESRSSSSTVTLSVCFCFFLTSVTGTVVPGFVETTRLTSASLSATGRPLNSRMTSPGSRPARAAGPSGLTVESTAPDVFGRPIACASSCVSGCRLTPTPITPRVTFPSRSCGSRSRTALIGMANPIPMLVGDCAAV